MTSRCRIYITDDFEIESEIEAMPLSKVSSTIVIYIDRIIKSVNFSTSPLLAETEAFLPRESVALFQKTLSPLMTDAAWSVAPCDA